MASTGKTLSAVQIALATALSTAIVFAVLKYWLHRGGRPDIANLF